MKTKTPKRSMARVRRGLYNYRAYMIERTRKGWVVRYEDGSAASTARTLRIMRLRIDRWVRIEIAEAEADENHCPSRNQGRND